MPFYDKHKSRLKLAVFFPHGQPNQYWYSPVKHNHLNDEIIIKKMISRLADKMKGCTKIQVYDNFSKQLIYIIE